MQPKKKRSVHHAAAAAARGNTEENTAFFAARQSSEAAPHSLFQSSSESRMKKKVRRQREGGAEAHAAEQASTASPREGRSSPGHRRAAKSKSLAHSTNCCIVLTHCPLYLFRDKRHSSTAGLLNMDDHRYLLAGRPSSSSTDNFAFPFLDKIQAQLRQLHDPFLESSSDLADAAAVPNRGMAAATEAAGARAAAVAEDRRLLVEACMRSDVVHQCLLNILDSIVVSQLRTGIPHFAGKNTDAAASAFTTASGEASKGQPGAGKPLSAQPGNMNFELLLHTMDGKLLRVSPSFRVPRNFKVFKKVATMALSSPTGKLRGTPTARSERNRRHGWASQERVQTEGAASDRESEADDRDEEEEETLIEVLQPPFWRHLPDNYRPICLSASRHAPKVVLRRMMTELREEANLVFMISACPYLDAAAIPRCLVRPRTTGSLLNGTAEMKGREPAGDEAVQGQTEPTAEVDITRDACTPVVISISNFPMSAAVRCDRLIYEVQSLLPSAPPS
ncbi:hypothetical protein TGDOM2_288290 [Toxoplasma gondii GAB2-2007-GAL-DOM2]|uniref:Uncharacterized protein n=5 Tax=Toxoplasma gondii TaxID=5811 RepID=S7UQ79_TOXGG|nr:hypothetical protein TGGT1_288290 [Toxoplasma gondii GT1]KAF4644323.1 hypothetical protein TGRH88_013160 [Toxoplasma gondii]KFG42959.1 hypothetical protein TGDOM2_288290 [Toxoplasma gondii GAB2-2007-GAL-DOM2]KFG53178.1 hypothetical protein TGFOU_288290 [Toxoplasma gondii FOU]RQX73885.1 hypothetical protein TGCAST_288290 [Toxoplasma gondii CAST]